jgi:hypothetical protein
VEGRPYRKEVSVLLEEEAGTEVHEYTPYQIGSPGSEHHQSQWERD